MRRAGNRLSAGKALPPSTARRVFVWLYGKTGGRVGIIVSRRRCKASTAEYASLVQGKSKQAQDKERGYALCDKLACVGSELWAEQTGTEHSQGIHGYR